jgi:RNA polymerase subunit RPABC4/transcription elongation factor Spt4
MPVLASFGDWEQPVKLAAAIVAAYWAILWLSAIIWTYRDVRDRGSDSLSQTVAMLLVLVFNIPGLILYLILRPHETLAEAYVRNLETEAMMQEMNQQSTCFSCQRRIQSDFVFCPHCRARLQDACAGCGKPISLNWVLCPYCGRERMASASYATARPAATAQSTASPERGSILSVTPGAPNPQPNAPQTEASPPGPATSS